MSGCLRCGHRSKGRLCRQCEADERAADRAANRSDDHPECPTCGGSTSGQGVECYRCRRGDGVETDGGQPGSDTERRDPTEDPRACSLCGIHIGLSGGDYCDGCAREIGVKLPLRRCVHCGQRRPEEDMEPIDVSGPDEYYPEFEYLCPACPDSDQGGQS